VPEPIEAEVQHHGEETIQRELWGTRVGFILAAVGSAVGLGNMWRFPYVASEGGGAAFVLLYIGMTLAIGIPIMLAEFVVGRRGRLSPIGALRKAGGPAWVPMGFLFVLAGFLILSYYSVIAGWTVRYGIDAILFGFSDAPGDRFNEISTGFPAMVYHVAFMIVTITIVMLGVEKGIEKAALVLMPTLFVILIGLAVWASTLDGALAGYAFYLKPSLKELLDPTIIRQAAAQAFFSLSLGMGAMLTFASYLSRDENLNREAVVISFSDFSVAFVAGLVVFPVIFALGLQGDVGESAVGALFISLPGAFVEMGSIGRWVGLLFFLALTVGALTSAISLLEVVTASIIDEFRVPRKPAAVSAGIVITLLGLLNASSLGLLGVFDKIAGELFLVLGAFGLSVLVGWRMEDPEHELRLGASPWFAGVVPGVKFTLRYIVPPVILFVLWFTFQDAAAAVRAFLGG
jgi:NSS family neurotransmitter:Na+ symporter